MATKKIIDQEIVFKGHFRIVKYTIENTEGNKEINECFERGNAVAAVIFDTDKQKFIFTQQFRIGAKKDLLEIVAGTMDKAGEGAKDALIREVEEELGYEVDRETIEHIASVFVSPGGTSEKVHIFFAAVHKKISNGGGLDGEDITIIEKSPAEILDMKQYEDAKTVIGMSWAVSYLEKLAQLNPIE